MKSEDISETIFYFTTQVKGSIPIAEILEFTKMMDLLYIAALLDITRLFVFILQGTFY